MVAAGKKQVPHRLSPVRNDKDFSEGLTTVPAEMTRVWRSRELRT
jgi:hypothetical protein